MSAAPRLLVRKIIDEEKSTLRLSPSVKLPLSRMPKRRFHKASEAFSISSKSTMLTFIFSVWCWFNASCDKRACHSPRGVRALIEKGPGSDRRIGRSENRICRVAVQEAAGSGDGGRQIGLGHT